MVKGLRLMIKGLGLMHGPGGMGGPGGGECGAGPYWMTTFIGFRAHGQGFKMATIIGIRARGECACGVPAAIRMHEVLSCGLRARQGL